MSKARALLVPAVTAAMELSACAEAPKPEPEYPIIMVDIGPRVSGVLDESASLAGDFERRPVAYKEKKAPPLTLETIMQNVPDEDLSSLDGEIESYRRGHLPGNMNGSRFVSQCETSDKAMECVNIRWKENERVRREYPNDFVQCDYIMNDDNLWFDCVMLRVKADPQALDVMKYCRAQVRDCVADEIRKVRE